MIDSKKLIYLPGWAKVFIVAAFGLCLLAAVYVSLAFVGVPDHSDWILLSLSLAQLAATALVLSLILIFGEREANLTFLISKTHNLLLKNLPKTLGQIKDSHGQELTVSVSAINNIFGANYRLENSNIRTKMWIGFNVDRIIVAYYLKTNEPVDTLKDIFKYTFGGAESVGYKINYEPATIKGTGEQVLSIWCTWPGMQNHNDISNELLNSPDKKLFIIQDIAMMTQSFIRTAERNAVDIFTDADPAPL
ncbi:hypothetical protein SAMN04487857_10180 [Pseudomonas sp. ok272]|uniref:hypothetical protein n=1 Tax=unclassified Pseudomonas TaxID=196821 RepID=UPI0008D19AFE|nr:MULTISPECIES: hypothetical protein [unclassified Pseudomonas]SEM31202.1 hypothetical protein SAMN04487857_10180 [Pseudomonas sp. ok272]SFM31218.1 hypothetical protein SAMN04487858_10280 [Pseudomonas sp. ok602]